MDLDSAMVVEVGCWLGDGDGEGKEDACHDNAADNDDDVEGREDACDGDEGAICTTSSSQAGDGWNIMLEPTIKQNAFQMGAIAKEPGL